MGFRNFPTICVTDRDPVQTGSTPGLAGTITARYNWPVKFQEHCEESTRLFGKPFEEVHLWLDEYASTPLGARHRRKRHHDEGVSQVAKLFGDEAAMAARRHIASDLQEEGWTEEDPFPKDEADYVRMGLF